jgi:hypothetical protein
LVALLGHLPAGVGDARAAPASSRTAEAVAPVDAVEVSGWVLFGLGGASFVAGIVTGIVAIQQSKQLDASCPDARCPPEWHAAVDAFHSVRATSTATLVAAGALGIAGVTLLLVASEQEPAASATARGVRLVIQPSSLGVVGVF